MWLANKYKANKDVWYLTEIDGCKLKVNPHTITSDRRINNGKRYTILIPFGDYVKKQDWVPGENYTISLNDIIFLEDPGEINANNIMKKRREFESFEIRDFVVVKKRPGVNYQIKVTN